MSNAWAYWAKVYAETPQVSCSSCGLDFCIPGRADGFSHCDMHRGFTPEPFVSWD